MTQRPKKKTKKAKSSSKNGSAQPASEDFQSKSADRSVYTEPQVEDLQYSPKETMGLKRFAGRVILCAALLAAFILRSIKLGIKPPHFDEGINGYFVAKVWKDGFYTYDPSNFHGPLYFYFLQFTEVILGRSLEAYRFATGLISLSCIILMAKHRRFFGANVIWAVVVASISTGFVFYSRYSIHESLFIFFQLLFTLGYFLYEEERSRKAALLMVLGFFGTMAVKETFVVFFAVWFIATLSLRILKIRPNLPIEIERRGFFAQKASVNDWIALITIGFFAESFLFSGFFLHPQGFRDMFAAFAIWTKTGTGNSGHEKPFYYWVTLLLRYEWPTFITLLVAGPLFFFVDRRKRLMILFALGTFAAYSLIPYKTPWLILNLLWPLLFVSGFALEKVAKFKSWNLRWICRLAFVAAMIAMSHQMLKLNFENYANPQEPYVYVQSTTGMKQVLDDVEARVKAFPEDLNMDVLVLVRDPWPLPWVFGEYPNLKYGQADTVELNHPGVILIDGTERAVIEKRLKSQVWRLPFKIRDSYDGGFAYLDFDKFKGIVPSDSIVVKPSLEATPEGAVGQPSLPPGASSTPSSVHGGEAK